MANLELETKLLKREVLVRLVRAFISDNFPENTRLIPYDMRPKGSEVPFRCCVYKERAILRSRTIAGLGFAMEDDDEKTLLSDFAKRALEREKPEEEPLTVLQNACKGCPSSKVFITELCQNCVAKPCMKACRFGAISNNGERSVINADKCKKCGLCISSCPYHAIVKTIVPCEDACPVKAISKGEDGFTHIDTAKCIYCGKCVLDCPFGAVHAKSQLIDVLKAIKDPSQKTVAMLAPAVIGQFSDDIGKVISAFKKIGFDEVVEVAQGADMTTTNEAAEFIERMHEGAPFMTTSCCPAWVATTKKHIPEIKPFVSNTGSPMYYIAQIVRQQFPDYVSVFIGPCLAKRVEAEANPNVDYVLVFEEASALLEAFKIDINDMPSDKFTFESSAQGRRYPLSGGVAGAVKYVVGEKIECKTEAINGLTSESIKKLKHYAVTPPTDVNMIEVMCCEGGCIAGPGAICAVKKATALVENYVKTSTNIKRK